MEVLERIEKAMASLERAKEEYLNGDKRLALGSLDYVDDRIKGAKYLIINEIKYSK
ncbi:hypothetical protein [Psychrobacillus phage Perkons]|nr:hypothetical protein [Psychrobacillus phage Perkons]